MPRMPTHENAAQPQTQPWIRALFQATGGGTGCGGGQLAADHLAGYADGGGRADRGRRHVQRGCWVKTPRPSWPA